MRHFPLTRFGNKTGFAPDCAITLKSQGGIPQRSADSSIREEDATARHENPTEQFFLFRGRHGSLQGDNNIFVVQRNSAAALGDADKTTHFVRIPISMTNSLEIRQLLIPERTGQLPDPGRVRIGAFQVLSVLGQGAFGTVYKAFDPLLDRDVALKVPRFFINDMRQNERFLRKAKAAASPLRHPSIVAVFESGEADGTPYIVSELVEGIPLSKTLKSKPPDVLAAVQYVRQIAEALHYAHGEGIVHRDLKPANIMMNKAGRPQVTDFGVAKRTADDNLGKSIDPAIVGTPAYMAPEQARGENANVGPLSDQYSIGVILYEMLCGLTPYSGDAEAVMKSVGDVNTLPPAPRTVRASLPRDLEACCLKAIDKNPQSRYPNLQALADDLQHGWRAARWWPVRSASSNDCGAGAAPIDRSPL